MKLYRIFATIVLFSLVSAAARGQLLKLIVKDKALQEGMMFINHGEFLTPAFDASGVWTYANASLSDETEANVMLATGHFVPVLIEPGKTISVTITQKQGKPEAKYKGASADASEFLMAFMQFHPAKTDPRAYEDMEDEDGNLIEREPQPSDSITYEEAFRQLTTDYDKTLAAARRVKDATRRAKYEKQTALALLAYRLSLTAMKAREEGRKPSDDADYRQLLAEIDPDDPDGMALFGLPQTFVESKLTTSRSDTDQTAYALDNIANIDKYITNEAVRHRLLSDLGMVVFNSSYSGQVFEMDKFWQAFKASAPQQTIDYFQPIYDSRKATAVGTPCPDVTFSDTDGNKHHLSEYFGRTLYIDIWATWCIPCCAEIPYIEQHVEHYKDNPRIQFISISIDNKHEAWERKLEKDKPQWPQFICDREEQKTLSAQWGITGIPRFVIVNADGTIADAEAFRPSSKDFRQRLDAIIGNGTPPAQPSR